MATYTVFTIAQGDRQTIVIEDKRELYEIGATETGS